MTDQQTPSPEQDVKATTTEPTPDETDVEGHNLWISPSASYEMTKARNKDIDRQAREAARQKESKAKRK